MCMYVCCISIRSCICDLQAAILEFLWHADILHDLYIRVYIELFILFYILLLLEHVWKAKCQLLFILKYLWNSDVLDTVFILVCLCVCVCVGKSDALEAVYIAVCVWNTDIIDCLCWNMCVMCHTLNALCIGVWNSTVLYTIYNEVLN